MQEANKPPDSWFDLKVNTHVYVTGLPDDVTVDEVSSVGLLVCCVAGECLKRTLHTSILVSVLLFVVLVSYICGQHEILFRL